MYLIGTYTYIAIRSFVIFVTHAHVWRYTNTLYTRYFAHGTTVRSIRRSFVSFTAFLYLCIFFYYLNICIYFDFYNNHRITFQILKCRQQSQFYYIHSKHSQVPNYTYCLSYRFSNFWIGFLLFKLWSDRV